MSRVGCRITRMRFRSGDGIGMLLISSIGTVSGLAAGRLIINGERKDEPVVELFDLQSDPAESHNMIEQHRKRSESMQQRLQTSQASVLSSLSEQDYR